MRMHRCCFTGRRPQKLRRSGKEIKANLENAIQQAIADGYTTFITGMAYGVDIWQVRLSSGYGSKILAFTCSLPSRSGALRIAGPPAGNKHIRSCWSRRIS